MADRKRIIKKESAKTKRDPSPSQVYNKVNAVSESTKALSKEIKGMAKIFKDNQKILVSMSDMMESISLAMTQMQKQAKQINIIEEDTQRLFTGLNQVKIHEKFITKLNKQTEQLDKKIVKIDEKQDSMPKTNEIIKSISESKESIRNNSKMIMKIANRVDQVKDKMDEEPKVGRNVTSQIEELRDGIRSITSRTGDIGKDMSNLKNEIGGLVSSPKISSLIGDGMKTFKSEIEEKISNISNMIDRSDQIVSEFHQKTDKVMHELQSVKGVTNKASDDSSKEVVAILKLNEYQSSIRMQAESKYGDIKDVEKMATQTTELINLFDRLSIETENKIPLPYEVRQWAVGKIFDCADKWELRFSEVFSILINNLGRELLKEAIRIPQVRDIFGIRAVDEIRNELNIS
ncbi:MAG: chemotaxis protein [Candidatus Nitrosopelagicus sp.]|nr:chemotaxis protein [Candidatus Nitrosopelagicus sp.]MBT5171831.1 chemotaxis protein [Candidatus Nitrosopelagicus sp.]|tara:strand:+ start:3018 stop:4229 length:1212 start_codon:yes stop_codon:yes gene_type:complete